MKISVMKKIFLLSVICAIAFQSSAQFNYKFADGTVPVVGAQLGVVGGGHTAMLFNRDDVETPFVKMQTTNFTYFGGLEHIRWFSPHFGFGQQILYWNGGAKYAGPVDTISDEPRTIDGTTQLTYAKVPLLFYWKSYSRWKPDRRLRVNTFFGPYAAVLLNTKEEYEITTPGQEGKERVVIGKNEITTFDKDGKENPGDKTKANGKEIYKPFDYGFTMGVGIEIRLWMNTVVALSVRTDLGLAEVENKDFGIVISSDYTYLYNKDNYSKYISYNSTLNPDFDYNRSTTTNMSFGAQLSIRKYIGNN